MRVAAHDHDRARTGARRRTRYRTPKCGPSGARFIDGQHQQIGVLCRIYELVVRIGDRRSCVDHSQICATGIGFLGGPLDRLRRVRRAIKANNHVRRHGVQGGVRQRVRVGPKVPLGRAPVLYCDLALFRTLTYRTTNGGNIMTTTLTRTEPEVRPQDAVSATPAPVVVLKRRTIDSILIGFGAVACVAFAVAGGLLTWGNSFASDYVGDELSAQNIVFPSAEGLTAEGRTDLLEFAGQKLDTGKEAEAYASYIDGHLTGIADGATFAELGGVERAANAEVAAAKEAGDSQATIDELSARAAEITGQRNALFKGETLRGLLLSAYAWSTVGSIAGYAAIGAFIAAGVMAVLVVLGMFHHRKVTKTA